MDTLTIKIRDQKALKLIYDLEFLELIQVVGKSVDKSTAIKKLSETLAGSINKSQAETMHTEINSMRNEWERSTY